MQFGLTPTIFLASQSTYHDPHVHHLWPDQRPRSGDIAFIKIWYALAISNCQVNVAHAVGKAPTPNFTTAEQVIPQRFLLVTAIMLPVLFNNGLGRTMKGATGFGLRSL